MIYYERAIELYSKNNFVAAESVALANLCICFNHLNLPERLTHTMDRLKKLVHANGVDRHPYLRILLYKHIDAEDFSGAYEVVDELKTELNRTNRLRDVAEIFPYACYVAVKNNFTLPSPSGGTHRTEYQQKILGFYKRIRDIGLIEMSDIQWFIEEVHETQLDFIDQIYLLELLAELALRSQNFDALTWICKKSRAVLRSCQEHIGVVDFRYYEVMLLIAEEQFGPARKLLNEYKLFAVSSDSRKKIEKAHQLKTRWTQAINCQASKTRLLKEDKIIIFDLKCQNLYFDKDRKIAVDLKTLPVLRTFFQTLIQSKKMICMYALFREVYGLEYHPILHRERFNSLISRSRKVLPLKNIIIRSDSKIGINPEVKCIFQGGEASIHQRRLRKQKIARILSHSNRGLSMSSIHEEFSCSKRTLLTDISQMIEQGMVVRTGHTRASKYFSKESLDAS